MERYHRTIKGDCILLGRQQAIYDERDRKLAAARTRRQVNRQSAQAKEVA